MLIPCHPGTQLRLPTCYAYGIGKTLPKSSQQSLQVGSGGVIRDFISCQKDIKRKSFYVPLAEFGHKKEEMEEDGRRS